MLENNKITNFEANYKTLIVSSKGGRVLQKGKIYKKGLHKQRLEDNVYKTITIINNDTIYKKIGNQVKTNSISQIKNKTFNLLKGGSGYTNFNLNIVSVNTNREEYILKGNAKNGNSYFSSITYYVNYITWYVTKTITTYKNMDTITTTKYYYDKIDNLNIIKRIEVNTKSSAGYIQSKKIFKNIKLNQDIPDSLFINF